MAQPSDCKAIYPAKTKKTTTTSKDTIRIICHNTFWFQGVPFADDQPPPARRAILTRLSALYERLQPDILCLQEIHDIIALETLRQDLAMPYIYRPGRTYPQYGGAIFSRLPFSVTPANDKAPIDRLHMSARVELNDDRAFTMAHLHLPSNRHRGPDGGRRQRLNEIAWLFQAGAAPQIVLGDLNESPQGPCAQYLIAQNYVDTAAHCGAAESSSATQGTGRGDQIWLHKQQIDHLQAYFVIPAAQLALAEQEKTFLSDHLPLGIDLVF